jgi:hypothetical protein
MASFPQPIQFPPKEFQAGEGTTAIAYSTSPTVLAHQSTRVSLPFPLSENAAKIQFQRASVRDTLGRISTQLSPLQSMFQMQHDFSPRKISSIEKSRSGSGQTIQVKMDYGLNKFVNSVVGRKWPATPVESPMDPMWPQPAGLKRGPSIRSNGGGSSNPRSSSGSNPTIPARTSTSVLNPPTPH